MRHLSIVALAIALTTAASARASTDCPALASEEANRRIRSLVHDALRTKDLSTVENDTDLLLLAVAEGLSPQATDLDLSRVTTLPTIIAAQETRRTDKQVGASARSEGTTTVAEKSAFPLLLGMALESGAVQQTVSGTVLTLSTTPYALVAATTGDTAQAYRDYALLRHLGASASFRIGDAARPLDSVGREQLAEWSIRAQLTHDHSARSDEAEKAFQARYARRVAAEAVVATSALREMFSAAPGWKTREDLRRERMAAAFVEAKALLAAASPDEDAIARSISCGVRREIVDRLAEFEIPANLVGRFRDEVPLALRTARQQAQIALQEFDADLDALQRRPQATLAYSNIRPETGSSYSVGKLIVDYRPSAPLAVTLNGGASVYHHPDAAKNQKKLRDLAFSLALEGRGGRSPFLRDPTDRSPVTFSASARYQRLEENDGVEGRRSGLFVAQIKAEFPVASGVTLPMSVSWANATELIAEKDVRAHFGVTLDVDKLLLLARR
jgi:hypothetical protein